jgi:hypothetical protein
MQVFAEQLAARIGRRGDDFAVQALVGAVVGVGIAVWSSNGGMLATNYLDLMDQAFAQLEAGFTI